MKDKKKIIITITARFYRQDMSGVKKKTKRQHPTTHNTIKILTYKKKLKGLHIIGKLKDKLITLSTE